MQETRTIDRIAKICCHAAQKVLETGTGCNVRYAATVQSVPKVSLRPEIGCFIVFNGDYNGLVVINFSDSAAMTLYRNYMLTMGMGEDDLAINYTSSEVPDTIGEICNQIMGQTMSLVEEEYGLSAFCSQPKALALNTAITLTIDSEYRDNRRIVFTIDNQKFYVELALEPTEFIRLTKSGGGTD